MVEMSAAFRPRFRRGAADDAGAAAGEAAGGEAADDLVDHADAGGEHSGGDDADDGVGDDVGDEDAGSSAAEDGAGEWLAYEFHEWSLESRVMLEQLLTVDQVVHSWQGTTLMVHESLEETVDGLVEEVEETEEAKEAIARPIGSDEPLTAFELGDWPEALRDELMERLVQARVPHVLDTEGHTEGDTDPDTPDAGAADDGEAAFDAGAADDCEAAFDAGAADDGEAAFDAGAGADAGPVCDLLVREADEERVEVVIDDLLAREEEADFEEMDGLEVNSLLSDLFMACDRLRRDPRDFDGLRGVMAHARRLASVRTPFGFAAPSWRSLRNAAGDLLAMVEDEDSDEDDLRELAHRMSDTLRTLI
ncbi:MAG: hypothetical protein OXC06_05645 [Acidimicrobiaceae bacterium]|nr:hypothetical protein [Acidimicrobiaceae bacterium]